MELQTIQQRIFEIRGVKVMLDYDLAELYDVETKRLKEAVRRNSTRFPLDFMFELTREEYNSLRSQFATLEKNKRGKHSKYLPFAFTEQGVAMLSSVLNSPRAIEEKHDQQFDDINEAINYLLKKDTQSKQQKNRKSIGFSQKE